VVKQMRDMHKWSSGKVPEAFVSTRFSQCKLIYQPLDVKEP